MLPTNNPTTTQNVPSASLTSRCAFVLFAMTALGLSVISSIGCSTTKSISATEQLLMSDAIDRTVEAIDFRPLAGNKVYLDTTYLVQNRNPAVLVNTDYVISSLRQQMVAAGCMIVQTRDEATYIAEARIGALGTDGQLVTYGIPENSAVSRAASLISSAPALPSIPEIALARRDMKTGAAKLAVFAYDKATLEPVWQSGLAQANSSALDTWVLGVGPFRRGTIEEAAKFASKGTPSKRPLSSPENHQDENPLVDYRDEIVYGRSKKLLDEKLQANQTGPAANAKDANAPVQASATNAQDAAKKVVPAAGSAPAATPAALAPTPAATPAPVPATPAANGAAPPATTTPAANTATVKPATPAPAAVASPPLNLTQPAQPPAPIPSASK